MFYKFTFNNGVAIVEEAASGKQVVHQPFNPSGISPKAWANEQEAQGWVEENYGYYLTAEAEIGADLPDVVEEAPVTETPADTTPADAQGA